MNAYDSSWRTLAAGIGIALVGLGLAASAVLGSLWLLGRAL